MTVKAPHVNKRKNTDTHHFWINCGNKGATSWGQTNPRRPIVIAKNTLIDKKRNKVMQSERLKHTDIAAQSHGQDNKHDCGLRGWTHSYMKFGGLMICVSGR